MKRKLLLGALVALATTMGVVTTTHADPPAGSGFDENPDVTLGGGSDTTYLVMQRLEVLYNGTGGCAINTAEGTAKGKCISSPGTQSGPTAGNYDHDIVVSATPTGSGSGVDALRVGMVGAPAGLTQYTPPIDYARSSSGPSGTRLDNLTYWGYARDAITVLTFGTRSNLCITQAQLQGVYSNTITDWSQLTDCTGAAYPAAPIIPWAMNGASGTNASFNSFVAPTSTATNGRRLQATNIAPFENDVKPLLADAGPDGVVGNADDEENNYLWWISNGDFVTYPFTKNGCKDGAGVYSPASNTCTLGGTVVASNPAAIGAPGAGILPSATTINNSTYPIVRTIYHVTRNTDADCITTPGVAGVCNNAVDTVYGNTTGTGGAVRQFTTWLCRATTAGHLINPVTGRNYRTEIVNSINAEGFQQTVTNTTGYRCSVST
jgi:ABC-type phosphate transport system substrate-binding protein